MDMVRPIALLMLGMAISGQVRADEAGGPTEPGADQTFLRLIASESAGEPSDAGVLADPAEDAFVQQVDHNVFSDPAGEMAQMARDTYPTPVGGHGYAGVAPYNLSTDPASATVGPRLDQAFGVLRDFETAYYLSEHQHVTLTGATILPVQTPCLVWGVRTMGGYSDNLSMTDDHAAYSIDSFWSTRYKSLYHKLGFFIDDFDRWKKLGLTYSALTELPVVGTVTFDSAFGFRSETDEIFPNVRDPISQRSRRVEQTDLDYQIRVGKFWCESFQSGLTGNYYPFTYTDDEWGAGVFANVTLGRLRISGDVTGGKEGLRGYLKLALSFGAHPRSRPRDCRLEHVDAIGWATRATDRDQSIRLRESLSGPIPIAP